MSESTVLSAESLAHFRRDGFVVARGLFSAAEAREMAAWTDEILSWPEVPGRHMMYYEDSRTEPGRRVLSRIENFCPYHDGFGDAIRDGRLAGAVSQLLGEPATLFKDKINMKLPGGGGFEPHQDVQAGWNAYASYYITAMVSIDPTTAENGCLELVRGWHDKGMIGEEWAPLTEAQMAGMRFEAFPTEPGDAVFFDSFAPHGSQPNVTPDPRRVLYITYNRTSEGDHRARYYADKRMSFPPDIERVPGRAYAFRV